MEVIAYHAAAGVARITLQRPEKRNALNPELIAALREALAQAAHQADVRVVLLAGAGKDFCACLDLKALDEAAGTGILDHLQGARTFGDLILDIRRHPKPVICAVHGRAFAGGAGIATASDLILATESASFGYPEVKIGFVPAIVATFLLRQVGEKVARELLLTGRIFDAAEALKMSLINEIVPSENLLHRARELAAQLAENSPLSLFHTKRLLTDHARAELDTQIEVAVRENAGIRESADFREGITSFLERRKPTWTGR